MKKMIFFMGVVISMSAPLIAAQENLFVGIEQTQPVISLEEKVLIRMRWLGQIDRIGQLLFESREYAKKSIMYVAGGDYVADVDGINQTITTNLPGTNNM